MYKIGKESNRNEKEGNTKASRVTPLGDLSLVFFSSEIDKLNHRIKEVSLRTDGDDSSEQWTSLNEATTKALEYYNKCQQDIARLPKSAFYNPIKAQQSTIEYIDRHTVPRPDLRIQVVQNVFRKATSPKATKGLVKFSSSETDPSTKLGKRRRPD